MRIYVAPDNPSGRHLADLMRQQGVQVLGMVDNLKTGADIINHAVDAQPHDAILIAKSDFQQVIAEGMVARGFQISDIWLLQPSADTTFAQYQEKQWWQLMAAKLKSLWSTCLDFLPRTFVVYYADKYADSNVLVAFDAHQKLSKYVYLVVKQPQRVFHPAQVTSRIYQRWLLQRAKVVIVDHESTELLFNDLRTKTQVVQLWHGLPFKHLAGNKHFSHINDQAFVSSSSWFNQQVFPTMFNAKNYLAFGYPRNDGLIQSAADRCWHNALPLTQFNDLRQGRKLLVFMPTYRDNGNNQHPIDWPALQQLLVDENAVFVMKTHPFLAPFDELRQHPGCDRIFHYPGRANIYPWLADADLLLTDYSSVAFDFLLCNKPIVHFIYDIDDYAKVRGKFVLAREDFIAGATAVDSEALLQQLKRGLHHDDHALHRAALMQKFEMVTTACCPQLIDYLECIRISVR